VHRYGFYISYTVSLYNINQHELQWLEASALFLETMVRIPAGVPFFIFAERVGNSGDARYAWGEGDDARRNSRFKGIAIILIHGETFLRRN
jgi:hypothetical protein